MMDKGARMKVVTVEKKKFKIERYCKGTLFDHGNLGKRVEDGPALVV